MKEYFASLGQLLLLSIFMSCANPERTNKIIGESVTGNQNKPLSFQKIAPLTTNAWGSRKNVHEKGWWIFPPTKGSVDSLVGSFRMSSKVARSLVFVKLGKRASDFPGNTGKTMEKILSFGEQARSSGTGLSKEMFAFSLHLTAEEWKLAKKMGNTAGERWINGYLILDEKIVEDKEQILKTRSNLHDKTSVVYKSLNELFLGTASENEKKITGAWKDSYAKTTQAFLKKYEASGTRGNSFIALWDIFQGYSFAIKELIVPTVKTTSYVGETIVVNGVFVPVSYLLTATSEGIVTTGMVFYYPTKIGYRVVSPSLEAGLFSSIGIATASSTVPTLVVGGGVSAFNQVTTVVGSRTGEGVAIGGAVAGETTALVTGVVYDFAADSSKAAIYPMKSGLLLGYAGISALPSHFSSAAIDGPIFLAYDGPRVVIAKVRGNYAGFDELPTGTIVDLEEAKKAGEVEILTADPSIIKEVLDAEIDEKEKENSDMIKGKN
ncbi:hypothetical protein [Leptospira sp. 'Mane']|uniref:hypothetical protein n=1 Tax=Leptospira sp. 'Mane' TaxID=3387407 RepID=UPI00398BABB2